MNITERAPTRAALRSGAPLRLELLPFSERMQAMQIWRELEGRLSNVRVTCSSDWTEVWLRHYGLLVSHRFAVARREGAPIGIVLLTSGVGQNAGPFTLRTCHAGTAGELDADSICVEYNTLLVCHEDRLAFALALWEWAHRQTNNDEFRLDGFSTGEVAPLLQRHPLATVVRKLSRYFDLKSVREQGDEPIARLSQNTRSNIRRSLRHLGEPRGEWLEDLPQAEEALVNMIELHQARWTAVGQPGSYASRTFREFHLDLLHRLVPSGRMKLFRVRTGERVVGITQMLIDDNRALLYQAGWAMVEEGGSPGLATDYLCLVESMRRGYDAYDFLAGDCMHKQRLTTHATELVWVAWRRPRLKYAVIDTLRTVKQLLKRLEAIYVAAAPVPASATKSKTITQAIPATAARH
jgi:GNAT acetyltransferase-like protein